MCTTHTKTEKKNKYEVARLAALSIAVVCSMKQWDVATFVFLIIMLGLEWKSDADS
jgi:hypothetical protein